MQKVAWLGPSIREARDLIKAMAEEENTPVVTEAVAEPTGAAAEATEVAAEPTEVAAEPPAAESQANGDHTAQPDPAPTAEAGQPEPSQPDAGADLQESTTASHEEPAVSQPSSGEGKAVGKMFVGGLARETTTGSNQFV